MTDSKTLFLNFSLIFQSFLKNDLIFQSFTDPCPNSCLFSVFPNFPERYEVWIWMNLKFRFIIQTKVNKIVQINLVNSFRNAELKTKNTYWLFDILNKDGSSYFIDFNRICTASNDRWCWQLWNTTVFLQIQNSHWIFENIYHIYCKQNVVIITKALSADEKF